MEDTLLAYMAGFVDADGSIGIVSLAKHKRYVGQICVSNCNIQVVQLFSSYFGGKTRARDWSKNKKNPKKNWKTNYEWKLTQYKAEKVIKLLLPYLRVKRQQALLVLRLCKIKHKYNAAMRRWHPDLAIKADRVLQKLKTKCAALNQRGIVIPC